MFGFFCGLKGRGSDARLIFSQLFLGTSHPYSFSVPTRAFIHCIFFLHPCLRRRFVLYRIFWQEEDESNLTFD